MNSVVLVGNLTRDPELRYSTGANQTAVCRFGIAVNDGYGEKQETNFINIVVFGKQAENCDRFLAKGRKVAISGRLQTGSYTNKDGNKVYTTDVVANRVEFLGGGGQAANAGGQSAFDHPSFDSAPDFGGSSDQGAGDDSDLPPGFAQLKDDDIPF